MGMFDNVEYSAPCYKCGNTLTDWQSTSGPCQFETLGVDQVTNLYTSCDKHFGGCGAWNEYMTDATEHETHIVDIAHDRRFDDIGVLSLFKDGLNAWIEPGKYRITRISDVKLTIVTKGDWDE